MTKEDLTIEQVIDKGFGIDVHKEMMMVTVMGKGIKKQTREFKTFTEDLESCRQWLLELGITQGAIESTGVYWKPVFHILSESVHLLLVNARHIKNVPGRKTDVKDSEWICKLLLSGLLNGSFVPPELTRETRDLFRYKVKMTQAGAAEKKSYSTNIGRCQHKIIIGSIGYVRGNSHQIDRWTDSGPHRH
jgi:transposase